MKKIPVIFCIDVEPDEFRIDPNIKKDWKGFERSFEFFNDLRPRLQSATGSSVYFSWFFRMDPQIARTYGAADWVVRRYSSTIDKIKSAGDVLGLHVHAWKWNETRDDWFVDFDQSWVDHCVKLGFESFRSSLNEPCLHFRFGDLWTSDATLALVERLGARIDLTVEPGQKSSRADEFFGSWINTGQIPPRPYCPSRVDFRKPDPLHGRTLWIIPLSTGSTDWSPQFSHNPAKPDNSTNGTWFTWLRSKLSAEFVEHEGCLDRVDGECIAGWAYNISQPNASVDVEVYDGEVFLATTRAGIFRSDLLDARKGNGRHAFNISVPTCLKDGKSHSIRVQVKGTFFELNNSPKELKCHFSDFPTKRETLNLSFDSWGLCRLIDKVLTDSEDPYLAAVVRSDVAVHPDQCSNMEQTFAYLLLHPTITQLAFVTPAEMIAMHKVSTCEIVPARSE